MGRGGARSGVWPSVQWQRLPRTDGSETRKLFPEVTNQPRLEEGPSPVLPRTQPQQLVERVTEKRQDPRGPERQERYTQRDLAL